jgi:hypothetical protein
MTSAKVEQDNIYRNISMMQQLKVITVSIAQIHTYFDFP